MNPMWAEMEEVVEEVAEREEVPAPVEGVVLHHPQLGKHLVMPMEVVVANDLREANHTLQEMVVDEVVTLVAEADGVEEAVSEEDEVTTIDLESLKKFLGYEYGVQEE
jgi:hypothetical protein